jgi:hypothetical protein
MDPTALLLPLRVLDPRAPVIRAMLEIVFEREIKVSGEIGEKMRRAQADFKQAVYDGSEGKSSKLVKCYNDLLPTIDCESALVPAISSKQETLDVDQACDLLKDIGVVVGNLKVRTPSDLRVKATFLREALPRLPYELQEGILLALLDDIETLFKSDKGATKAATM